MVVDYRKWDNLEVSDDEVVGTEIVEEDSDGDVCIKPTSSSFENRGYPRVTKFEQPKCVRIGGSANEEETEKNVTVGGGGKGDGKSTSLDRGVELLREKKGDVAPKSSRGDVSAGLYFWDQDRHSVEGWIALPEKWVRGKVCECVKVELIDSEPTTADGKSVFPGALTCSQVGGNSVGGAAAYGLKIEIRATDADESEVDKMNGDGKCLRDLFSEIRFEAGLITLVGFFPYPIESSDSTWTWEIKRDQNAVVTFAFSIMKKKSNAFLDVFFWWNTLFISNNVPKIDTSKFSTEKKSFAENWDKAHQQFKAKINAPDYGIHIDC